MDSRTAAHVLSQIGALLELHGESRFKTRAYVTAAKALVSLDVDDIAPAFRSGDLARLSGIGPATLSVIADLVETGDSRYHERLRESTPEGLLEMLRVPGLGTAKIHQIHQGLHIETVQELEAAARDGRLAALPKFGSKTAEKILKGIAFLKETGAYVLYPHAASEAHRLVAAVRQHPDVIEAEVAGSIRRRREVIRDIDIVASCRSEPERVAAAFSRSPGVRQVVGGGGRTVSIRFVDGTLLDLHCVPPDEYAVALWRATGSADHERAMVERALARGLTLDGAALRDAGGRPVALADEAALYAALGLEWIPPELREGSGEIDAAATGALPSLIQFGDIKGVLHSHSSYSDGTATIAEMAAAARARGWSYLGISDHSQSAFYAGGLTRDAVLAQHEEIDRVNETLDGFRVLKGIEADILADGRVDYDSETLARFDYVIGSVHSRFAMAEAAMTERVLRALDDPNLTILGHPTGRLLLTREPYALDMDAVLEKAGALGVAVELNCDPHRLDMDWRFCRIAKERGVQVEIGPDAHAPHGLDNVELGIGIARKGWLEAADVLNTRSASDVIAAAASRRAAVR